jgi:hypothetical protein
MSTEQPQEQTLQKKKGIFSNIPVKALLANLAVIGASHGLGYLASGTASHVLSKTPAVQKLWNRMTPGQQRAVATGILGTAGAAIPVTVMASQLATQANLQEALEKKRQHEQSQGQKVASVLRVYRAALESK